MPSVAPGSAPRRRRCAALFVATLLGAGAAAGQDELIPQVEAEAGEGSPGWSNVSELQLVATGGNSESLTFGLRNTSTRRWRSALLELTASGLRAEATTTTRTAVGLPDGGVAVEETEETEVTAEHYTLSGAYERDISEDFFWHVGAGWKRDEFAGIRSLTSLRAGLGHVWFDDDTATLRTDYALTYTDEEQFATGQAGERFLGLRLASGYRRQLTSTTELSTSLVVDENLDETADLRADLVSSLAVAMTDRLSLKVSLQLLFDNRPAFEAVPVERPPGTPTDETVPVELEEIDSRLTVGLTVDL